MNDKRRSKLAKAKELLQQLQFALEEVRDEEQDALDNLPDSIRDGDRGEKAESAIGALEEAINNLEYAGEQIEEARQ